jgi:hypothetical protein
MIAMARARYDTSFFDGVSHLLISTRKTISRINKSPQSHTKNQAREVTEPDSSSISTRYNTSFFDGVIC